jgi:hypothetical protein
MIAYLARKITRSVLDGLEQWKLSKLDNALRKRVDQLYPGMAMWPRGELRRYTRRLFRGARVG